MIPGRLVAALALVALPLSALALLRTAPAHATEAYAVPATGLAITGHGFGHGHGLGQYGAQGAALQGVAASDILRHYYPGTVPGPLPAPATVRVLITGDTDDDLTVRADPGLALSDSDGASWLLPAGPTAWRVTADAGGGQHVQQLAGVWLPWAAPDGRTTFGQVSLAGPARVRVDLPGGVGRAYRGTVTAAGAGGAAIDTVDTLPFEQYLWGVVPRESPSSWLPAALQAQAVAARTYAAYERRAYGSHSYDLCDTTSCQVYGGSASYGASGTLTELETASTTAAVDATAGSVLLYGGQPAFTQFSASTGGWNADGGEPYLVAGPDPWDDFPGNSVHTWTTTLTPAALAAAYPTLGVLQTITVTGRDGGGDWGGRITSLVLQGTAGSLTTSGSSFAGRLGLRSPWWTVTVQTITQKWLALGGAGSLLGLPVDDEHDVPGGRAQDFQGGAILWSAATGPHEVHGLILDRYAALGGPGGTLGLPTSDEQELPGAAYSTFTGGNVYWSGGTGAQLVHGLVLSAYLALGGPTGRFGLPLDEEQPQAGGVRERFQGGNVYWSPATGAQPVEGLILARYVALGEGGGLLGLPAGPEAAVTGGRMSAFTAGRIYWSGPTGAHEVHGAILGSYLAAGGADGQLGLPTSGEQGLADGRREIFARGAAYWTPGTGAHVVKGLILAEYRALGQAAGVLGWPVAEESPVPGGVVERFNLGDAYWSGPTGAHEVHGAVKAHYDAMGGAASVLALPVADETAAAGGSRRSDFAGGRIYWTVATGAHDVHGSILTAYVSLGAASSRLGLPVSDEYAVPGGRRSDFVGGALVWDAASGRVTVVPR